MWGIFMNIKMVIGGLNRNTVETEIQKDTTLSSTFLSVVASEHQSALSVSSIRQAASISHELVFQEICQPL